MSLQPDLPVYKHLFFDMDGTLTRSRTKITDEMKQALSVAAADVVVVSGASVEQIQYQLDGLNVYTLGANGNHAVCAGVLLWNDVLSEEEKAEIMAHIQSLPRSWDVPDENDLAEDRGSQITYSLYGMHAPVADKEQFDPDQSRRKRLLSEYPLVSDSVDVKIAGTTGLDYFKKGCNKGYNVLRLIKDRGWDRAACCYFGDMLFPGGNDESVIGVIDTHAVADPHDTLHKLQSMFAL